MTMLNNHKAGELLLFPYSVFLSIFTEPIADGILIDNRDRINQYTSMFSIFVSNATTITDKKPAYDFSVVLCSFLKSLSYSLTSTLFIDITSR